MNRNTSSVSLAASTPSPQGEGKNYAGYKTMKDYIATIVKNEKIAENIHAVTFKLDEDIQVRCGQFGNISVGGSHLLRRPIAICKVDGREKARRNLKRWGQVRD